MGEKANGENQQEEMEVAEVEREAGVASCWLLLLPAAAAADAGAASSQQPAAATAGCFASRETRWLYVGW